MSDLDLRPSDMARPSADGETFIDGIYRPALTDADFRGCRWIDGEPSPLRPGMFCGSPVRPGEAWCAVHHGRVWSKLQARKGDMSAFVR